jgi:hypothetical protein
MSRHRHYFKDVSKLQTVDVYRVLTLFEVTDPCIQRRNSPRGRRPSGGMTC